MKRLIWILRASLWYKRLTDTPLRHGWGMAESLADTFGYEDYSPEEAVREDLTYWNN